jgi:hypothetical protein
MGMRREEKRREEKRFLIVGAWRGASEGVIYR